MQGIHGTPTHASGGLVHTLVGGFLLALMSHIIHISYGYNRSVPKIFFLFSILVCAGCISAEGYSASTTGFVTAALSTPLPAQPTSTLELPAPAINVIKPTLSVPIEGTTTTEINVRSQPSTASAALGTINIFTKVQITAQDSTNSWYQILYADSSGWVRAEYVQVNAQDEIPIASAATSSASEISALVVQKINVRKGPGVDFESLGTLNPNDVVFIIGRDESGKWAQVEFASAPDGRGWATVEFLKIDNANGLPVIDPSKPIDPVTINAETAEIFSSILQDEDSMQAPLGVIVFSPTSAGSLQMTGALDFANGDAEDWLQFTAHDNLIAIQMLCSKDGVGIELWNTQTRLDNFLMTCGSEKFITVMPNSVYFIRLSQTDYTDYILSIESIH